MSAQSGSSVYLSVVWLELMVPVLNIRALSGYAVQYLSDLFRYCDWLGDAKC